jgi:hypothetical protein
VSDRSLAKNRFHKGLTTHLRATLRRVGVSLDEEMAQFTLGGIAPFSGEPSEFVDEAVNETLGRRRELMAQWEKDNPNKKPYPPSIPERVLKLVNTALTECYSDEGTPVLWLEQIKGLCERELDSGPLTNDTIEEN